MTAYGTGRITVRVRLPGALRDLAGAGPVVPVVLPSGATVGDLLDALGREHPAVERRVRDERGTLRPHVNVFVGTGNIRDLALLGTLLTGAAEVHILPAVSGG